MGNNQLSGNTRILAVMGDPIGHTLSPAMHNAAFRALGWNYIYIPALVHPADLPGAVKAIRALNWVGANITIPHKEKVLAELDEVFGDSPRSGSVNTIINRQGRLAGTSTDGLGFIRSLREDGGFDPAGKRVVLLGAGGSAAAIVFPLLDAGIASLTIANRSMARAQTLQQRIITGNGFQPDVVNLQEITLQDSSRFDLVINTTASGLEMDESPIPATWLHPGIFVYDLLYHRIEGTRLCREAKEVGCRALDGLSMLLYQAAESFRLWFETDPPIEIMKKALMENKAGS